jgi:5-methylcytosine-specific restriction endonuclease McrA
MTEKKRNYKKEYKDYHGTAKQIAARSQRNQARAKLGLKVGDPRECDHRNPISKGGSNRITNLRAVSRTTNRKKGSK